MGRFIPRGKGRYVGRNRAVRLLILACGLFVAAPVGFSAQMGQNVRTYYFPARSFYIPFTITENDPRLEVLLNVSTEGQAYRYVGSARANERRFYFSAPADGWYNFIVQTRDASGVVTPDNLRGVPPSIRVCVDTQNPIIDELAAGDSRDNPLPSIRWKITEANLKEIWADYRVTGGEWMPLFLPVQKEGTHTWKPTWGGELEVRMQALDQAGHRSELRTLRLHVANNVTHVPPPKEPAGAGKVMFVKSKTFQLFYKLDDSTVGPSQVASVDIWKLHPGQGWRKCKEKGKPIGPATVSVDTAGRWGFRLIPRSGVGLAEPDPQPGDAPDIWVEVDDKAPLVKVIDVDVKQEADGGYLTVRWKADDAFLSPMPITILKATNLQAKDWTPLANASDLPNKGYWRQKIDDLHLGDHCYEFALKVQAIDEAGNIGSEQWHDTVKVDLKIPRIKSIEVKPDGGAAGRQQTSATTSTTPFPGNLLDSPSSTRQSSSPLTGSGRDFRKVKQR